MRTALVSCVLAVLMVFGFQARSDAFVVDWSNSWDSPRDAGYNFLGRWLHNNGYFSDLSSACSFARYDYIGSKAGDSDPFSFESSTYTFKIVYENSAYCNKNRLGYYTSDGKTGIFGGSANKNTPAAYISIDKSFRLYMRSNYKNGTYWYTDRTLNEAFQTGSNKHNAGGDPQALIYELAAGKKWLIAFEDLDATGRSDNDYNDMYILVSHMPEPATIFLFGLGALGLGYIRRKKTLKSSMGGGE